MERVIGSHRHRPKSQLAETKKKGATKPIHRIDKMKVEGIGS